jgi:hypothetical protein
VSQYRVRRGFLVVIITLGLLSLGLAGRWAAACPFCNAVSMTLGEEIKAADVAVIAKLVKRSPLAVADAPEVKSADDVKSTFEIVQVLKGERELGKARTIEVLYFGQHPQDTQFLIIGAGPNDLAWSTPNALSDRAVKYIAALVKLPESGPERLVFFQDYFEDKDSLLASDSYDEFAKAPYADVELVKSRMQHDKLVGWIKNPETPTSRRRLYLTMLGICGGAADVPVLEQMIRNEDRQVRSALDALVACYLNLRGADGMPLVEDLFLKNKSAEYTDTYATIMALRFHGQETNAVPKERLMQGLRYMLERPQLADLVIPDLARWQDWSVMDRLVKLFKDANEESIWVRVPVINYLRACPLPEAKQQIEELKKIDPEAVKRASQFFPPASANPPKGSQRPKKEAAGGDKAPAAGTKPELKTDASLPRSAEIELV